MEVIMKKILTIIVSCCIGLGTYSSKPASSYSEPEKLVSDFLDAYFNVTLEDAETELAEGSTEIPMHNFFTPDALDQVRSRTYELMMFKFASQYHTDITLTDAEIALADDSSPERYTFEVTVEYPSISLSEEVERYMNVERTEDGICVTDQIEGYIDVLETDSGWMIQSFRVRSASGSY